MKSEDINDEKTPDSLPDSFESLDDIIKKEAQQYDKYTNPDAEAIAKESSHDSNQIDKKIIDEEASETDKHYKIPDDETIKKESEEWYWETINYEAFKKQLPKKIAEIYSKINKTQNTNYEQIQKLALAIILHKDRRIYTIEDNQPLEKTLTDYAISNANPQASTQLTKEQQEERDMATAVIMLTKATEETENKKKYLDKTIHALKNTSIKLNSEDIKIVYKLVLAYEFWN